MKSSLFEGRHLKALEEHKQILFYISEANYKKTEQLLTDHINLVKSNFLFYQENIKKGETDDL